MEGEADRVDPPSRQEEESVLSRFTGLLRRQGPEEGGDREPQVIFKDPVAEPPRGASPHTGPGMTIPLRKGKGCASVLEKPLDRREEQPPPT